MAYYSPGDGKIHFKDLIDAWNVDTPGYVTAGVNGLYSMSSLRGKAYFITGSGGGGTLHIVPSNPATQVKLEGAGNFTDGFNQSAPSDNG